MGHDNRQKTEYQIDHMGTYTPVIAELWLGLAFLPFSDPLSPFSPPFEFPPGGSCRSSPGRVSRD